VKFKVVVNTGLAELTLIKEKENVTKKKFSIVKLRADLLLRDLPLK
jgi:hypothetical protein